MFRFKYYEAVIIIYGFLITLVPEREAHLRSSEASISTILPVSHGNKLLEYYLSKLYASPTPSGTYNSEVSHVSNDHSYMLSDERDYPTSQQDNFVEPASPILASAYLTNRISSRKADSFIAQKLLEQLRLSKLDASTSQLPFEIEADFSQFEDLNRHLPANDPLRDSSISGPINDPADFEATLSHLTSTLNYGIPNTSNRSLILADLLGAYVSSVLNGTDQEDDPDLLMLMNDNSTKNSHKLGAQVTSTSPPFRYGNSEYIDHPLALVGHQYVQGGAGEGRQLLGPDGTFENVQVIKSDDAIPSFCDPPNPCPIGYTAEDGCLEKFINSASFSREYQVKQQCTCDNEHSLFNCGSPSSSTSKVNLYSPGSHIPSDDFNGETEQAIDKQLLGGDGVEFKHGIDQSENLKEGEENASTEFSTQLGTLARAIQNRFGSLASIRNLIANHEKSHSASPDDNNFNMVRRST